MVRSAKTEGQRSYARAERAWSHGHLKEALGLFLNAARLGEKQAYRIVAQFYDFGDGTRRNEDEALFWYRRAHRECNDAVAANNIGCILRDRRDVPKALWWLHRAVKLGDDEAHLNIAKIYLGRRNRRSAMRHLSLLLQAKDVTPGAREEAESLRDL